MKAFFLGVVCLSGLLHPAVAADIKSAAPSIQLSTEHRPNGIYVAVKNISPHAMLKFSSGDFSHPDVARQGPIKSGEARELGPISDTFIVSSAVFDDGSYEGDPATAASMAEDYLGFMVQFERIGKCTTEILAGPGSDDQKFEAIAAAITKLTIVPNDEVMDRLARDFPSLVDHFPALKTPSNRRFSKVASGMSVSRGGTLQALKMFRENHRDSTPVEWWQMEKRSYEPGFLLDYRAN